MQRLRLLLSCLPLLPLLACSSNGATGTLGSGAGAGTGGHSTSASSTGTGGSAAGTGGGDAGVDAGPVGGDRPVEIHVPASYTPGTAVPLVLMLHGYSASADLEEDYLQITPESDKRGFIYARANGTVDKVGNRFWNATDACCDLYGVPVDDSSYLSSVITEIEQRYTIDPKRVYLVGHSNGAFMSYRMSCDHADQIAAIVSLAGAVWEDPSKCKPSQPVSILEIHGTADTEIAYDGGVITGPAYPAGNAYPSAPTTVADWVTFDGCSATPDTTSPPLDLDSVLPGDETTVTKYAAGCKPGGHAELWTITGGSHIPTLSNAFTPDIIQFLYDHPRP